MSDITVRLQITLIFVGDENWKLRPNFRILKYFFISSRERKLSEGDEEEEEEEEVLEEAAVGDLVFLVAFKNCKISLESMPSCFIF